MNGASLLVIIIACALAQLGYWIDSVRAVRDVAAVSPLEGDPPNRA